MEEGRRDRFKAAEGLGFGMDRYLVGNEDARTYMKEKKKEKEKKKKEKKKKEKGNAAGTTLGKAAGRESCLKKNLPCEEGTRSWGGGGYEVRRAGLSDMGPVICGICVRGREGGGMRGSGGGGGGSSRG